MTRLTDTLSLRRIGLVLAATAAATLLAACGTSTYEATGKAPIRGADAEFEVEEIEGDNTMVRVTAEHLAPPSRIDSGLSTYVVWFVPSNGTPQKAGTLEYDADARSGEMRATSPRESFTVRMTAERNGQVVAPSRHVIFEKDVRH